MSPRLAAYLAFVLDFLIVSSSTSIVGILLFGLSYTVPAPIANWVLLPIMIAFSVALIFGYWPYFWFKRKGYTPGRALVGLPKP